MAAERNASLRLNIQKGYSGSGMPEYAASTKATGGGGYTFADKVAAGFPAQMLLRNFPLEPELGGISALHFETRDAGNVLDDLLLILKQGQDETKCAVSVKSNRQLTNALQKSNFPGRYRAELHVIYTVVRRWLPVRIVQYVEELRCAAYVACPSTSALWLDRFPCIAAPPTQTAPV